MPSLKIEIPGLRGVLQTAAAIAISSALTGCSSFFMPVCQAYNTCSSTGTGTGTGSGGGTGSGNSYAYVANANTGTIAAFPITAGLTKLTGTSYNLGTPPLAMAASPKGNLLYLATAAGSVFVYGIAGNGGLTLANGGNPVTSTLAPTWMSIDPSGNWLFLISSSSPQLLVFQIDLSTGALVQTNQGTIALDPGTPTQVYLPPDDKHIYVGLGSGGMDGFVFDASNGVLSGQSHLRPRLPGVSGDNTISSDTKSTYLFVGEAGVGIRVFTIAANGALQEISGSPFPTELGPSSMVVDSTDTYLYVANRSSDAITGYTIGTTGALTALSSSPFQTGSGPTAMALDSSGKYLLVISAGGSPDLEAFSFDATTAGKLDSVASASTGADPTDPVALAIAP